MRDILKKVTTGAMIAGAALLVAACGGDAEVNTTNVTELDNTMPMDNMETMDDLGNNMVDMGNMSDTGNTMDNMSDGNTTDANNM